LQAFLGIDFYFCKLELKFAIDRIEALDVIKIKYNRLKVIYT